MLRLRRFYGKTALRHDECMRKTRERRRTTAFAASTERSDRDYNTGSFHKPHKTRIPHERQTRHSLWVAGAIICAWALSVSLSMMFDFTMEEAKQNFRQGAFIFGRGRRLRLRLPCESEDLGGF